MSGRFAPRALLAAICSLAVFPSQSSAITKHWGALGVDDWNIGENWSGTPPAPPTSADEVRIDNGGTARITESGSAGAVILGNSSTGTGTLEISLGGHLTSGPIVMGAGGLSSSGNLNIFFGTCNTSGPLSVGDQGSGHVQITTGSRVEQNTTTSSHFYDIVLGRGTGSSGDMVVNDSTWILTGRLGADLTIGARGPGTLEILNHSQVSFVNPAVYIGFHATAAGSYVNVDNSTWNVGPLYVGAPPWSGTGGTGDLYIQNAATVNSLATSVGAGSTATVSNSTWNSSVNANGGTVQLHAGAKLSGTLLSAANSGQLHLNDDAVVTLTGTSSPKVFINSNGSLTQSPNSRIVVSTLNSNLPTTAGMHIGTGSGGGTLEMLSGGQLNGGGGDAWIDGPQNAATAFLSDMGTRWFNTKNLTVGKTQHGKMFLTGGARVDLGLVGSASTVRVGEAFDSNGEISVQGKIMDGAQRVANLTAETMSIGHDRGTGILNIYGGGAVTTVKAVMGELWSDSEGYVTVEGQDSAWFVRELIVGDKGIATLNVRDGAYAGAPVGESGESSITIGNFLNEYGPTADVIVEGVGSRLETKNLTVGNGGYGALDLMDGAIAVAHITAIGTELAPYGTLLIDNATLANFFTLDVEGELELRNGGQVIFGFPEEANLFQVHEGGAFNGVGVVADDGSYRLVVQNDGTVAPGIEDEGGGGGGEEGGSGGSTPGTLAINANYTQSATGRLRIDLASPTSYDVLNVAGAATLGGTLEINLLDGYTPSPTDSFDFLAAGSKIGAFSNVTVTSSSGDEGGSFSVSTTPTGLALTNYQPPQPPEPILIFVGSDYGRFGILDVTTGIFTQTGTASPALSSMTRVGAGPLYGTDHNASLRAVDPQNGASTLIGNSGLGLYGIAQRSDGQLFGVSYHSLAASLYTINPATGGATLVGPLGVGNYWYNVAFDDEDTLYMVNAVGRGGNSTLYSIDTTTGLATLIGLVGTPEDVLNINSLAFVDGVLYGFTDGFVGFEHAKYVVEIDTETGAGTPLVSYDTNGIESIYASVQFVPAAVAGDFNLDGTVDAADYVVWRKGIPPSNTPAAYNTWRSGFGEPSSSGSGATANSTVPEPATLMLLMFAAACWCLRRRRAT